MGSDASRGSDSPSALTALTLNLYSWPEIENKESQCNTIKKIS